MTCAFLTDLKSIDFIDVVVVLVGNVGLGQLGMDVAQAAGWSMVHASPLTC